MVSRALLGLLLATSLGSCIAGGRCTTGTEYEPSLCQLRLPRIVKVTIEVNAAKSPAETDQSVSCTSFSVREKTVRCYLANAKTTNENDVHHTLDWSSCYAMGKVYFEDGSAGTWSMDQFRVGALAYPDGRKLVLYCPDCKFAPFRW